MTDNMEKRRHDRVRLKGYISDIADGNFIYGGILEDVSTEGLRLNDLPTRFSVEGKKYSIVVSGGPAANHYKLIVVPCWNQENGASMDVGFKVVQAPADWKALVRKIVPIEKNEEEDEDVWDQFSS